MRLSLNFELCKVELGVVAHTCHSSTLAAEAGGLLHIGGQHGPHSGFRTILNCIANKAKQNQMVALNYFSKVPTHAVPINQY